MSGSEDRLRDEFEACFGGLAAVGLTALMAGAVITNVAVLAANPRMPAVYLVLFALIAWRRRDRTAAVVARFRR